MERKWLFAGRRWRLSVLAILLFFVPACAGLKAGRPSSDESQIRKRVEEYWGKRVKGEYGEAYDYEYPLFRKKLPKDRYIFYNSNPIVKIRNFKIEYLRRLSEDVFEVRLDVEVRLKVPGAKAFDTNTVITERWVRDDGHWYHVPERLRNSMPAKKK